MRTKCKIVYIIDILDTDLAGTENQLLKLIKGLDGEKMDVHLVVFSNHPWFEKNRETIACQSTIFEISNFKQPQTYMNVVRLALWLKKEKFDVVHTFFPVANIVGVIAARIAGIKTIVSSRRDYGEWMTSRYLLATRFANRFVGRITTNSHQVKRLTVKKEKVEENRISVIYNGIDSSRFSNKVPDKKLKGEIGIGASGKVVGIVANFRPMKNHQTLIRAAREIQKVRNDVDYIFVGEDAGDGSLEIELRNLARDEGVENRIHFVGAQSDVKKYLSIMNIGINCSEGEGLSNAIMEYMASGLPSIVSNGGGNTDLIEHEKQGLVFSVDDYQQLASYIIELLNDEDRSNKYASAARNKIEQEMSTQAMLDQYADIYRLTVRPL